MAPVSTTGVLEKFDEDEIEFTEFLRAATLSVELYRIPEGMDDPQDHHTEDEVYYIISGKAKLQLGEEVHPVEEGDIAYVGRGVEHKFTDIEEDLEMVVFFTPPYGSLDPEVDVD